MPREDTAVPSRLLASDSLATDWLVSADLSIMGLATNVGVVRVETALTAWEDEEFCLFFLFLPDLVVKVASVGTLGMLYPSVEPRSAGKSSLVQTLFARTVVATEDDATVLLSSERSTAWLAKVGAKDPTEDTTVSGVGNPVVLVPSSSSSADEGAESGTEDPSSKSRGFPFWGFTRKPSKSNTGGNKATDMVVKKVDRMMK